MRSALLGLALLACGPGVPGSPADTSPPEPALTGITIITPAQTEAALRELAALTPGDIDVSSASSTAPPDRLTFAVTLDRACRECFQLTGSGRTWEVHTGDVLGAQYGIAALLEHAGYRFRHPFDTDVPATLAFDPSTVDTSLHTPDIAGPRGVQLHTLHPIEGYLALWDPGDDLAPARRIFDWLVKNRGNYIQWPALDDIMADSRHATWQATTAQLIELAHARGLEVGLGVQIFGHSNLQRAFDLSDGNDFASELAARLPRVIDGLAFDRYSLSFGEFFSADPQQFIDAVNLTTASIHAANPSAIVHASIHVGADLRVSYMNESLPYYFLVKFADPSIVPNLHTVMYYNLYEDAGGAYEHADFHEHREYLLARLRANQPALYYPEDAYWIAFDNSVPLFLPLYIRSRWLDLDGIARDARAQGGSPLTGHMVFSSGFEWGYWLNDVAALRASYALPDDYAALIADALGPALAPAAPIVSEIAAHEADALITHRLAPYLAGRDALIDAADAQGTHSQPDRVTFAELRVQPWAWSAFQRDVLDPLAAFAAYLEAAHASLVALGLPDSRWSREITDGVDVTAARARFILSAYEAVLATSRGDSAGLAAARGRLEAAFARGEAAVRRRHADLHDPDPRLTTRFPNATIYQYGYHFQTDSLCYWRREKAELAIVLDGATAVPPTCTL